MNKYSLKGLAKKKLAIIALGNYLFKYQYIMTIMFGGSYREEVSSSRLVRYLGFLVLTRIYIEGGPTKSYGGGLL